jgi:two-component system, OmpR family, KDP operon response regulator KdpE
MNTKKILVVDDNRVILATTSMKLRAAGYEVLTAEDGSAAVSTARTEKPDLILMDISFPPDVAHGGGVAWDGFLIMEWLRRIVAGKQTPVIVISGGELAKYRERALQAGAAEFFQKPIKPDELLGAIRRLLGENTPPTSAPPSNCAARPLVK